MHSVVLRPEDDHRDYAVVPLDHPLSEAPSVARFKFYTEARAYADEINAAHLSPERS